MQDLKPLIIEILDATYLMSLGTTSGNSPWVADVIFVYDDDLNIYWLSKDSTRHSSNISINQKVAASITSSAKQGEDNKGLQIEGDAFKVDGLLPKMAIKHLAKRKKIGVDYKNILAIRNESWYMLKPTNIEVIYEPLFGYVKQKFILNNN